MTENNKKNNEPHLSQRAVALRYNRDKETAPRIVAKGSGYLAERIIEMARAHGITIYEDKELIELLSRLEPRFKDVTAQHAITAHAKCIFYSGAAFIS